MQRDVRTLRDRVMDDVAPLVSEQTEGVQRLLQAPSHADRLDLFERMVTNEKNRLLARKANARCHVWAFSRTLISELKVITSGCNAVN